MKKSILVLLFLCCSPFLFAQELYRFEKNGKYGFKDPAGKVIVKPIYEQATDTITSLGGVRNKDAWAVMNNLGMVITDFKYNGVGNAKGFDLVPVYTANGIFDVNKYFGMVNAAGDEIAAPHYSSIEILSNDL